MRCILVYNGAGQPEGLRDGVAVKGIQFPHGVEVEVSAELAGQVLQSSLKTADLNPVWDGEEFKFVKTLGELDKEELDCL